MAEALNWYLAASVSVAVEFEVGDVVLEFVAVKWDVPFVESMLELR